MKPACRNRCYIRQAGWHIPLPKTIAAPSDDGAIVLQRQRVIAARRNGRDVEGVADLLACACVSARRLTAERAPLVNPSARLSVIRIVIIFWFIECRLSLPWAGL